MIRRPDANADRFVQADAIVKQSLNQQTCRTMGLGAPVDAIICSCFYVGTWPHQLNAMLLCARVQKNASEEKATPPGVIKRISCRPKLPWGAHTSQAGQGLGELALPPALRLVVTCCWSERWSLLQFPSVEAKLCDDLVIPCGMPVPATQKATLGYLFTQS